MVVNKPVAKFKSGSVEATIFENEIDSRSEK
jgi:hypothetical protein